MTEYPPILSGSALEQIAALRDYLVRRARDSESAAVSAAGAAISRPQSPVSSVGAAISRPQSSVTAVGADALGGPQTSAAALRALVVKTADRVEQQVERLSQSLHEDYLARSDFGEYQEQIDAVIRATARQIVEGYDYAARLSAADAQLGELAGALTRLRGEIRRGLIRDPETGEVAFGIAIAEELRFTGATVTENGLRYEELAPGQTLGLYTASGWQFWINGSKRGWFDASDGQLHLRSLTAEQELRLGPDWSLSAAGGFGIRYTGA